MVDYLVRHLEPGVIPSYLKTDQFSDNSQLNLQPILYISELFFSKSHTTGGHRTRVAAVTLDNMAEDAVAASASLWQILTVSVRYCGPAFVS